MTEKRKLYIITQNYPYGDDETTFIEPELKYLQETAWFDITIISSEKESTELASEVDKSIQVINIPIVSIFENLKKMLLGMKYGCFYFFSKDAKRERLELRNSGISLGKLFESVILFIQANVFYHDMIQKGIDLNQAIIYTYWCHVETLAIALHKNELQDSKLISRIHGFDLYDNRMPHGRHPFRGIIDGRLDKLFFIAGAGLEYYVNKIGKKLDNKYVLSRLGIVCAEPYDEIRARQKEKEEFLLVSCSNLIPIKRVELIVQALHVIDGINIHWIHFGDGSSRRELEAMASELLADKGNICYEWKGKTDNQEILSFYKKCLIGSFITTSQSEGCPVSVQEAMAFGLPIIATAVGEIPFMVDGNGILLSENPSPQEVADAIEKMCSLSPEDTENMRRKSRDIWEQYFNAKKNYQFFAAELMKL